MIATDVRSSQSTLHHVFGLVAQEVENARARGQAADVDAIVDAHPELADEIHQLLPTVEALCDMGPHDATNIPPRDDFTPKELGDFRLLREIGRGGMGVVYEAQQLSLGRRVAVKVLPLAALLDQRQLERFKNEARAAAMLKHPNIVSVHSVGCERSVHFYAMELVQGQSLAEVIAALRVESEESRDEAPLVSRDAPAERADLANSHRLAASSSPPSPFPIPHSPFKSTVAADLSTVRTSDPKRYYRRVAELGIQAARALDHAHQQGVIHRDIKPANLLLDSDGKLLITDFGLAHIVTDASMTISGDVLGTLRYMSPEQARGERGVVDHRSDLYSLGVTLYELATLRPAFDGTDRQQLLHQISSESPKPPRQINPRIPRDLETIILKSIAKQPDGRFATAEEFAEDLARFTKDLPVAARRQSRFSRVVQWTRRNRTVATLMALAALLLLALGIGGPIVALRQAKLAGQLQQITRQQQFSIYARDIQLAGRSIDEGKFVDAERILLNWVPQQQELDLRGFEWFYQWERCHDPAIVRTIKHPTMANDVAFHNNGAEIVVGWFHWFSDVWDLRDPSKQTPDVRLPKHNGGTRHVVALPQQDQLARIIHKVIEQTASKCD